MDDHLIHLNNGEGDPEANRHGNGNVYLARLEYPRNDSVFVIRQVQEPTMSQLMQVMVQIMQNNNVLLHHQLMQINNNNELMRIIINNNNQLLPRNVVQTGNVQSQQLDPSRENPGDGINNLLALYVGAQGAIFNAAFFVDGRRGCEILWSRFILSGLVSLATIVAVLKIFFQQFTGLRDENFWRWFAQKAAFIVMLIAFSVCLLLCCTSVLCISQR